MTRKKFMKLMMATGLSRDQAYYNAALAQVYNQPYQRALELYAVRLVVARQFQQLFPLLSHLAERKNPWNL